MNVLIIYAHPNDKSFNYAIREAAEAVLIEMRYTVRVRSLYDIGFDPVLSAKDLQAIRSGNVPPDIKAEQEHVAWADVLVCIYPVWWTGLPAVMKGYIDRVFSFGFAYLYEDGQPKGLLTGRKVFIVNTTGSPQEYYAENGMHEALRRTSDQGIFVFCGLEVAGHVFLGAVPSVSDDVRAGYLKDVVKALKKCLGASV